MINSEIILSFCIPTFNRGMYIVETIESIVSQYTSGIEIVISDNNSTDNTAEIVREYQKKYDNIIYYKAQENKGADINYLKSVELASGKYCWFLGSDDTIIDGAVDIMIEELQEENDIYLCSEFFCDTKMKPYKKHYLLTAAQDDKVFDLAVREELIEYFSLAQSHSALFGYLSSIVFNREKWNSIEYNESYTGTLYSHMYMLYSFIKSGCKLKYIKKPLVNWRGGNDSFGGYGKIQSRYLVDIDGFSKIIADFFVGDASVAKEFKGAFRRHHTFWSICMLRRNVISIVDWRDIERKLIINLGYNPIQLIVIRYNFIKPFLFVLSQVYRVVHKIRRTMKFPG